MVKNAGLCHPPIGIKSSTGQEPEARPRQHIGTAIQPVRPLLWTLGGAALLELDGKPIRGHSIRLPCCACF